MADFENNNNLDELDDDFEEENPLITLLDDEGKEVHFEILDCFDYSEKSYVVLLPYEEDENEVVILEVIHHEDEDEFLSIDDEELLYKVFDEFKNRNADNFNFEN